MFLPTLMEDYPALPNLVEYTIDTKNHPAIYRSCPQRCLPKDNSTILFLHCLSRCEQTENKVLYRPPKYR